MSAKFKNKSNWLSKINSTSLVSKPKPIKGTKITILGCGASSGTPVLYCKCPTCTSKNSKNNRTRASIVIQTGSTVFLIDTSPDLRFQAMREKLYWIDAVLFTHPHADHVHGIDELRSFNFILRRPIPCYGNHSTINAIHRKFDYIFKYSQEGGGKPAIDLHPLESPKIISGVKVIPLHVDHGKMKVLGFRINNVAYITDCSYIPEQTFRLLKNLDVLILDCLRPQPHPTHVNIEQSLAIVKRVKAKKTFLTHFAHEIEYGSFLKTLPKNIRPCFDGMKIKA